MSRFLITACKILILVAGGIYLAACEAEKAIQWSADGKWAVVLSDDSLYLCDDQGNLSGPLLKGVERAAWLPDSSHLAVVRKQDLTWDELAATAPLGFDKQKIISAATIAANELHGYEGKLDDFRPSNSKALTSEQWTAALLYLKLHEGPWLEEKLGDDWKDIENLKAAVQSVWVIPAFSAPAENGIRFFATLDGIDDLRAAPDGRVLAIVTSHGSGFDDKRTTSLSVVDLRAESEPILVATRVSRFPDWSPDGRDIIFVRYEAEDTNETQLGRISRVSVRDAEGAILGKFSKAEDLATVLFQGAVKVSCLPDGRILFAAAEATLPAGKNQLSNQLTLFSLNPGEGGAISRILPGSADQNLPDLAGFFEVSPDGRNVAVPGSKGEVSIVTLASGELTPIIGKGSADLRTIPVWRNSQQLCLVAPAGSRYTSSRRSEVILWSENQTTILSQHWPDSVLKNIE